MPLVRVHAPVREQADEMEGPVGNEARVDHGRERFDGFQRAGGDDLSRSPHRHRPTGRGERWTRVRHRRQHPGKNNPEHDQRQQIGRGRRLQQIIRKQHQHKVPNPQYFIQVIYYVNLF